MRSISSTVTGVAPTAVARPMAARAHPLLRSMCHLRVAFHFPEHYAPMQLFPCSCGLARSCGEGVVHT
eukprot:4853930-Prymnesium_polylepis.1